MNQTTRRGLSRSGVLRIVGTLVALGLLIYLLAQQGWQEIAAALTQIPLWRILLAFGLMMISRFAISARWYVLLRAAMLKIPYSESVKITFAGLFATNFLPTTIGGDVFRLAGAVRLGYDVAISTASLIADRLVGMAGMAMSLTWGLPVFLSVGFQPAPTSAQKPTLHRWARSLALGSAINKLWKKTIDFSQRTLKTLALWLKKPRSLLVALGYSWIHMLCFFGLITILLHGMGDPVSFWLVGGLYSLVYFITLLPISINGYGVQELSMTYIFYHFAGVPIENGLTLALLFRTLTMLASLPGAAFLPGIVAGGKGQSETPTQPESSE